jgi:hypothetical protein
MLSSKTAFTGEDRRPRRLALALVGVLKQNELSWVQNDLIRDALERLTSLRTKPVSSIATGGRLRCHFSN